MRSRPSFLLPVLGFALLLPACSGKAGAETAGQTIRAATNYNVNLYAPGKRRLPASWDGKTLDGTSLKSADFKGSVTVVNFWASWCGPCRVEQPVLQRMWELTRSKGVKFVGVTVRDTLTNARAHVEEFGVTYPSIFTRNDSTIAYKLRVLFVPTTFILDRSGRIAAKILGATHEKDLQEILESELKR